MIDSNPDFVDFCTQAPHQAFGQEPENLVFTSLSESTSNSQQTNFFEQFPTWLGSYPTADLENNYSDFISPDLSLDLSVGDTQNLLQKPSDDPPALEEERVQPAEPVGTFAHLAAFNINPISGVPGNTILCPFAHPPTCAHDIAISTFDESPFPPLLPTIPEKSRYIADSDIN